MKKSEAEAEAETEYSWRGAGPHEGHTITVVEEWDFYIEGANVTVRSEDHIHIEGGTISTGRVLCSCGETWKTSLPKSGITRIKKEK